MKRVCSYCNKLLKDNNDPTNKEPHKDDMALTHGCCNVCFEKEMRAIGLDDVKIAALLNKIKVEQRRVR